MTPEEALETIWTIAMEASVPLKNYRVLQNARQILEEKLLSPVEKPE